MLASLFQFISILLVIPGILVRSLKYLAYFIFPNLAFTFFGHLVLLILLSRYESEESARLSYNIAIVDMSVGWRDDLKDILVSRDVSALCFAFHILSMLFSASNFVIASLAIMEMRSDSKKKDFVQLREFEGIKED